MTKTEALRLSVMTVKSKFLAKWQGLYTDTRKMETFHIKVKKDNSTISTSTTNGERKSLRGRRPR